MSFVTCLLKAGHGDRSTALTSSEPQSRFGDKLRGIGVNLLSKRDCGLKRVQLSINLENSFFFCGEI